MMPPDWMEKLPTDYRSELDKINAAAVKVRTRTRTLLVQVAADLAEAQAANSADIEPLAELARQLETSLGDPGESFDELVARLVVLEATVARHEHLLDGVSIIEDGQPVPD